MCSASIELPDAAATAAAGERAAPELAGGMVLTLSGDLGAGKTTLVRGMLRGLGWTRAVKSPTYTLVEHYPFSNLYFYHFDFYRFAEPSEWETAGLSECFDARSVCVVEWPERVRGMLPVADLALTLTLLPLSGSRQDGRLLAGVAQTEAGKRCLQAIVSGASRSRS
jgi:tRNA threonylcarbamoyladenosine biosynthesis protein TsaE